MITTRSCAGTPTRTWRALRLAGLASAAVTLAVTARAQVAAPWLSFTGPGGGSVEVPHAAALNPGSALTIEAWVYLRSAAVYGISGSCPSIVGKNFASGWALFFGCGTTNLRFYARGSASSVLSTGSVAIGEWTHVAATYDGTTTRFFIDGSDAGSSTTLSGPIQASSYPLRIGNDTSFDASPDGSIDEVRLWSVARSQAEIAATMGAAIDAPRAGLVAVWHLDGNGNDAVGGHHGTVIGDARFDSGTEQGCPFELFVPTGGHLPGVGSTQWVTDLSLFNRGTATADTTVYLLPRDRDNSEADSFTASIPRDASLALPDLVLARFGESNLAAALRICSNVELLAASRTYNKATTGTFGQGILGETRDAAVSAASGPRHLTGLFENASFRTNVGFANTAEGEAEVHVEYLGPDGIALGTRNYTVPPYGHIQRTRAFRDVTVGEVASGSVRVTAVRGAVLVYASVIDGATGDPSYMLAR